MDGTKLFGILLALWISVLFLVRWFIYEFTPYASMAHENFRRFTIVWAIVLATMIGFRLIYPPPRPK